MFKDAKIEKDNIFSAIFHMTGDGYISDKEIKKKWSVVKMTKALNKAELAKFVTARHVEETKASRCWPCSGPGHTIPVCEDIRKREKYDSKFKHVVTHLYYDKDDAGLEQSHLRRAVGQVDNKANHLNNIIAKQEC